jgi:RNA polymerase sigma-70 factor (ECF subfamily)
LFRRHQAKIVNWCYRYTLDREAAFDLTQEIFAKAYRSFHTFRGNSRFSTWIYVIARNHCLNAVKRRMRGEVPLVQALAARLTDPASTNIHQRLEQKQAVQKRMGFVTSVLTATEIRVMLLHFGLDLSLDVITRDLGLTNRSGAKAFIVSARRKLVVALRTWNDANLRPQRTSLPDAPARVA